MNSRPRPCKGRALPAELPACIKKLTRLRWGCQPERARICAQTCPPGLPESSALCPRPEMGEVRRDDPAESALQGLRRSLPAVGLPSACRATAGGEACRSCRRAGASSSASRARAGSSPPPRPAPGGAARRRRRPPARSLRCGDWRTRASGAPRGDRTRRDPRSCRVVVLARVRRRLLVVHAVGSRHHRLAVRRRALTRLEEAARPPSPSRRRCSRAPGGRSP